MDVGECIANAGVPELWRYLEAPCLLELRPPISIAIFFCSLITGTALEKVGMDDSDDFPVRSFLDMRDVSRNDS